MHSAGTKNRPYALFFGAVLFLATSCLQGRPLGAAFTELAVLGDGVQLCPGNHPTPGFAPFGVVRRHHGFSPLARRQDVWDGEGRCLVSSESVHPPHVVDMPIASWLERGGFPVLETMYPGYVLGTGIALEDAMRFGVPLAVDVSHVHMQHAAGVISDATWRRLMDYDRIEEVHVSANDGQHDQHALLAPDTFGLDWARARLRAGTPTVLECYFHRLGATSRQRQIDLVRDAGAS